MTITTVAERREKKYNKNIQRNIPSEGIFGLNWWDYFPRLEITWRFGSDTKVSSGEGSCHLGGTDTPEGDKDQGGDGGEDDDNHNGRGAKGKGIQHNNQRNVPSKEIWGLNWWDYFPRLQIQWGFRCATRDISGEGCSHLLVADIPNEGEKDEGGDGGEDDNNHNGRGAKGKKIQQGSATRGTSEEGGSDLGGTNSPNEGDKDEGGDGGEDDDTRKGRGAKGREIQQNNQRDVRVIVNAGHEHMVWNRNPEPEQLKNSHITPTLQFLFKKAENTIESNIQVKCCMDEESAHQNSERFGWFQYELHVSFQCLEPGAARPSKSELLGLEILKRTDMVQEQINPSQLTVEGTGGAPGIASVKFSLYKSLASMLKLNQTMMEMADEFISGTRFCANCVDKGGPTLKSMYTFKLWPEVPTNKLPNGSDKEKYKGMFCTVYPNFKANWSVLRQDICKYELEVKRHVCELVLVARIRKRWGWKQNLSCHCDKMLQTYKVTLYINHDMSNIETLAEFECRLHEGYSKNKLVGLGVPPSNPASDEASSSTQ